MSLNQVLLAGRLGSLIKLTEQETYKVRIKTDYGNHRIYISKDVLEKVNDRYKLSDFNKQVVAIKGHIDQTLLDEEKIVVDRLVILGDNPNI
jgi:hypothetical protein